MKRLWGRIKLYFVLRRIKKTMKPVNDEGKKYLYTDKFDNKWYTLINPANLHPARALNAWIFAKDSEYGMSSEKLKTATEKINEAINKNDLATIAKVNGIIEAALELYAEPAILLNLATCYTFLNNEKNDAFVDHIQDNKRAIWENDPDCKSFFLQFALQFTVKFSESQKLSVQEYLEKAKPITDLISSTLIPKK